MSNFAIRDGRRELPHIWHLGVHDRRPQIRPIARVGSFELNCSPDVDRYITAAQNRITRTVREVLAGQEPDARHWQAILDCLGIHFVRSESLNVQIGLELERLTGEGALSESEADAELERLVSHRHLATFERLCDCATATFSNLVTLMAAPPKDRDFITSDSLIRVQPGGMEVRHGMVLVAWFPMGPRVGMLMCGEEQSAAVVRLAAVEGQPGRVEPTGPPREPQIRQSPLEPVDVDVDTVDLLNGMVAITGRNLFSRSRKPIDAALRRLHEKSGVPSPYRYRPDSRT